MQDQKGCKNIRAEEEQITCCTDETTRRRGRRYRHKAGGERKIKGNKEKHGKNNKTNKQDNKCHCYRFRAPPIELNENKQKLPLTVRFGAIVAHVPLISRTGTLSHDLPRLDLLEEKCSSLAKKYQGPRT